MLMARLYDPTQGTVCLEGRDIRTFTAAERAQKIGFILQDPVLVTGAVRDNIVYGHSELGALDADALAERMAAKGLSGFLTRFGESGLETPVKGGGEGLSLGQKQLVAFLRAVLRRPDILILDEATANIDTVTEQMLEEVLAKLPAYTTKVIIAHRLNTIQNAADEVFFVGGGGLDRRRIDGARPGHAAETLRADVVNLRVRGCASSGHDDEFVQCPPRLSPTAPDRRAQRVP